MKKEEIHLYDIDGILFGETPPIFLLETFIRTLVVFVLLLVMLRYLGKRMSAQFTITEFAVLLTLGAIISPAMQAPDRGILAALLLLLVILLLQRGLNLWAFKKTKVEQLVNDSVSLIIKDGVLQIDTIRSANISNQQIYSELRSKGVFQLGRVKRMYLEGEGMFSVFETSEPRAGLPILPPDDQGMLSMQQEATGKVACCNCGKVDLQSDHEHVCPSCNGNEWTKAVK